MQRKVEEKESRGWFGSAWDGIKSVAYGFKVAASTVASVFTSGSVRQGISNSLIQFWQGFSRIADPSILLTLFTRPQTARMYGRGQASTLLRVAPILLIRSGARPLARYGAQTFAAEYPIVETLAVGALDAAAYLLVIRSAVRGIVDNTLYTSALAQAAANESKGPPRRAGEARNPLQHDCGHDTVDQVTATIPGMINFYGDRGWMWVASNMPYVGKIATPMRAIFYGRAFLTYPLAAAGNCHDHRLEALNANNPLAMGTGASFLLAYKVLDDLIANYTGGASIVISAALWDMLWMHFTMVNTLARQSMPLPGNGKGMDVLSYPRALTGTTLSWAVSCIPESDEKLDIPATYKMINESSVTNVLRVVFLDQSMRDKYSFAYRPSARAYLEMHGEGLQKATEWWLAQRANSTYQVVNNWSSYVPGFLASAEDLGNLKILLNEDLEVPLQAWYRYIQDVRKERPVAKFNGADRIEVLDDYAPIEQQQELPMTVYNARADQQHLRRAQSELTIRTEAKLRRAHDRMMGQNMHPSRSAEVRREEVKPMQAPPKVLALASNPYGLYAQGVKSNVNNRSKGLDEKTKDKLQEFKRKKNQ